MMKTIFANALQTASGKILCKTEEGDWWACPHGFITLIPKHWRIEENCIEGEPCHIVPVALVDVEYLRALEKLREACCLLFPNCKKDDFDRVSGWFDEIDKMRGEMK